MAVQSMVAFTFWCDYRDVHDCLYGDGLVDENGGVEELHSNCSFVY